MEGYSVTEAASVLGVPTERVWELLARGVLSGAPDGETGMRVFLQPRTAATASPLDHARSDPAAGTARPEPAAELSPFRELLTEFRNLTERYGQALLALGEARGEVATLRSRVDLLEARMDLRLPPPGPMAPAPVAPAAWPEPEPRLEAAEAPPRPIDAAARADLTSPAAPPVGEDDEHEARPRRRRQRATENFAEALARAEDPTAPELLEPGHAATEPVAARAASPAAVTVPESEVALPREVPAAEPIDVAMEPAPATLAADSEASSAAAEDVTAGGPTAAGESEVGPEPEVPVAPVVTVATEEPASAVDDRPPINWDRERYTVEVAEPDWFEAAPEDGDTAPPGAEEPAAAAPPAWAEPDMPEAAAEEADAEPPARPKAGPAPGEAATTTPEPPAEHTEVAPPPAAPWPDTDAVSHGEEETVLWFGSAPDPGASAQQAGADEMEVVGGAARTAPSMGRPAGLPGGSELHEALSALEALARDVSPPRPSPAAPRASGWPSQPAREASRPSAAPPTPESRPPDPAPASSTPATRAYRRLRRIFPG